GLALQAQESLGKARTLANPSVSLLDGERSFILIGERRLYPKQTGTNSQGLPIFDVAEVRTGVYLQVAVQIGVEDDLTLTVYPQVSQVSSTVAINNSQYPIIATREAQTTVRLRNGETLAIGGLVTESDTSTVTRVPFLGHIPLIGELFTHRAKNKATNELLLFITPILERSEAEGEEITKEP
ncbi:MAG: type II and III secretion system protein, partial [Betaproteobacteria bacterium]